MFLFGIVMALFGAILPALRARLGIDLAQAGGLFLVMNAGMLATSLGLGPLVDRFGMKPPLAAGPVVEGLGLAVVASAAGYTALAWGALLIGIGGGALNSSTNALVADLHDSPEARSAALNKLGVFFGIGAVLMPFAIGLLLEAASFSAILLAAALVCLLVAVHNTLAPLPPPKQAGHPPLAGILALARQPVVVVFAALLFFQSGIEFVAGGFVSSFLVRETGFSVEAAAWTVAGYWGALMLARLVLSRAALRLDGRRLIVGCALATAASVSLLAASRQPAVAVSASLAIGAALAGIFPTAFGIVAARYPSRTGTVFGLLLAAALSGGMLLPWFAGQVGEAHGLRPALLVVAALSLAVAALAALSSRARSTSAALVLLSAAAAGRAQPASPPEAPAASRTILAIGAHAGDAENTSGAILARRLGDRLAILHLTLGEGGGRAGIRLPYAPMAMRLAPAPSVLPIAGIGDDCVGGHPCTDRLRPSSSRTTAASTGSWSRL
jgi:fucose permease